MDNMDLHYEIRPDWPARKQALTVEEKNRIIEECTLTGSGEGQMRTLFSLSAQELADLLLDANIERCPTCRWYVDASELMNDQAVIDGHCQNCRGAGQ